MLKENITNTEKSLLLYLETRQHDYGGRVNTDHMNKEDYEIAKKWDEAGFVRFGRIVLRNHNRDGTHWCKLSDEAFKLAYELRREKADRMWENRTWISTEDSRELNGDPRLSGMNYKE